MKAGIFNHVVPGDVDPMFDLKVRLDSDASPNKVDLGAGVYRDENGAYYEFEVVKKAKQILDAENPGHDYELTTGNKQFLKCARKVLFGPSWEKDQSYRVASVQTISGTGSNHLAAVFLSRWLQNQAITKPKVFVGTPAWGNYKPLFRHAGLQVIEYGYYDERKKTVDVEAMVSTLKTAPDGSIFVLQGCCHNPTGMDLSESQWIEALAIMKAKKHFPLVDIAYQGLGYGLEQDAFGIRLLANQDFEFIVCQSFSKNMGLYSERVGALHCVLSSESVAVNVLGQLRNLIRWEFSSSPSYGARLATIIMSSESLYESWITELAEVRARLCRNREALHRALVQSCETPEKLQHIQQENGLFCLLDLTPTQVDVLERDYHIYLPRTGRINVAGLTSKNGEAVAATLNTVLGWSSVEM